MKEKEGINKQRFNNNKTKILLGYLNSVEINNSGSKRIPGLMIILALSAMLSISCDKEGVSSKNLEAIDMGLSVKWGSCNVGASKPEEYGNYYAWGETKTKDDYSWPTYTLGIFELSSFELEPRMTKYCEDNRYGTVDNKTILEKADDIAAKKLRGNWRIPTEAEWLELLHNCTWTRTTRNSINGYWITSKKTGKSIFLPAAGYLRDIFICNEGSYGYYWSSSLDSYRSNKASGLSFYYYEAKVFSSNRCDGFSVRPVCDY